jgi:hypothetical protein
VTSPADIQTTACEAAEAARYALLRRLASSLRHHLVVNLQPIGMVYEVMERRLRAPEPNLADVHDSAQKINGFARAALASCLDVVTWLAPEEGVTIGVQDGIRECLSLVATSFTFRGYTLRSNASTGEASPLPGEVSRSAMRTVLTAALLHVTDENAAPSEVLLSAESAAEGAVLTLELRPVEGDRGFSTAPNYRKLDWSDVSALANAEGVAIGRDGRRWRLTLPWIGGSAS